MWEDLSLIIISRTTTGVYNYGGHKDFSSSKYFLRSSSFRGCELILCDPSHKKKASLMLHPASIQHLEQNLRVENRHTFKGNCKPIKGQITSKCLLGVIVST